MGKITYFGHSIPGGPKNQLEYVNFLYNSGVFDKLKALYAKNGVLLMDIWPSGVETICTNFPLNKVTDYKGKVGRSSGLESEIYSYLGATVMMFPSPEMYTAMQTGRVEFIDYAGPGGMWDFKLNEVAKYLCWPPAAGSSAVDFFFNPKVWNELPSDLQNLIAGLSWATGYDYARKSFESDSEAVGKWIAYGRTITGVYGTPEFRQAAMGTYAKIAETDADFKWAIDKMWEYLKKQVP